MKPRELLTWTIAIGGSAFVMFAVFRVFYEVVTNSFPNLSAAFRAAPKATAAAVLMLIPAVIATVIVLLLRSTKGKLEFSAFGLKFKGPAGPITLWGLTFLAVSVAMYAFTRL
jgi:cytochrome b561